MVSPGGIDSPDFLETGFGGTKDWPKVVRLSTRDGLLLLLPFSEEVEDVLVKTGRGAAVVGIADARGETVPRGG